VSKGRRENSCGDKVRHSSRIDAQIALRNSLNGRIEQMAPYPCKFCGGWHVGHFPLDAGRRLDPKCVCGHLAITHDSFAGMGCHECDCLQHREWVYRSAIAGEQARAEHAMQLKRKSERIIRLVFAKMPALAKRYLRRYLRAKLRKRA